MATFVLVSQHNWQETRDDGSVVITYRPPETLEQARDWPGCTIVERESEDYPPCRWGHGTFQEVDGKLKLVACDWDSSG